MKNFVRCLRLALQYRWTFALSVFCAVMVGVLWGGNITAVYPFVQIAFQEGSLQEELDLRIDEETAESARLMREIDDLRSRLDRSPPSERDALGRRLYAAEWDLWYKQFALRCCRWVKPWVDAYLPRDPLQTLALLVGLLLLGTLVKSLFVIANGILVGRLSHLGEFELRKLFYRRTLRMDLASFTNEGTSDLMSRFTHDMNSVAAGLNVLLGKLIREPLKMFTCLALAAVISWPLLLFSLAVVPLAALLIRWLARTLKRANRRAMEEMALLYNTLEETLRGIKVVKAFTMEPQERMRFHENAKAYYRKSMRIVRYDALSHPMIEVVGMLIICLALLAGAYLVTQGTQHVWGVPLSPFPLSTPLLITFYALLAGAADPARKLSDVVTALQRAAAASDRIFAMIDRESAVDDPPNPRPLPRHHRSLVFDRVDFAYRPDQPVLRGIDLEIEFGETIAVVGPNGCGKSTLANLVPRFADPTAGAILLDGIPLREVRLRDLRGQIGLVTQDPVLFDGTVFENIRYGSPGATRDQVVEAAERAHAHEFITTELSAGYESPVGPMGGQLSGGQRQRIALARAILRDPALLLLDEATSQIDLESERLIQEALRDFVRGRTTIIITHRLGAIGLADRVVVMHEGRIVDVGTHGELTARCPSYRRLHQLQFEDLRATA